MSMNNNAQATGTGTHAWVWSNGQVMDLGTLGGPTSWGYAINDSGGNRVVQHHHGRARSCLPVFGRNDE